MVSIIRPTQPDNNPRQQCRWHGFPSTATLEFEAAGAILNSAQHALKQHGAFHLVLAGGTTPRRIYELLRSKMTDWRKWHIYYGDERCLPAAHAERNSHMAAQALLDHVGIPQEQIHIIPAEQGADIAASAYASTLSKVALFDLVLLGLGEDGHTASLFPGHEWGTSSNAPATLAVHDAPKPPAERVSLSAHRLCQTRQLMFLVTGDGKRQAVADWRSGSDIPAVAISPACGVDIFLEKSLLKPESH